MRNSFQILILLSFIASLFVACEDENGRQLEKSCCADIDSVAVSPINPNGDSELALLMRQCFMILIL